MLPSTHQGRAGKHIAAVRSLPGEGFRRKVTRAQQARRSHRRKVGQQLQARQAPSNSAHKGAHSMSMRKQLQHRSGTSQAYLLPKSYKANFMQAPYAQ